MNCSILVECLTVRLEIQEASSKFLSIIISSILLYLVPGQCNLELTGINPVRGK